MELTKRIAAALGEPDKLTADESRALLRTARSRVGEIRIREAQIRPNKGLDGMGPLRRKALTLGTADEVRALDEEAKAIALERAQLSAQLEALAGIVSTAAAREAAKGIPEQIEALGASVRAVELALAAVADARDAMAEKYRDLTQARQTAMQAHLSCKDTPAELISRLIAADPQRHGRHTSRTWENLSQAVAMAGAA